MRTLWLLISTLLRLWHERQARTVEAMRMLDDCQDAEVRAYTKYDGAWRPALGWLCVVGLGWQLFVQPFLTWISPLIRIPPPPSTDLEILATLVSVTLGIAGLRSVEKVKGVAK